MTRKTQQVALGVLGAASVVVPTLAEAQSDSDLAKQLANPIAALISVPLQLNYDERYGSAEQGHKYTLNVQPVVPFKLGSDWTLISRTILPIIGERDVVPGSSPSGIGDVSQSLFFSPKPSAGGLIWGAGPVFLLPTGSDDQLSARKWGIGPTAVVLKQENAWTYGALMNHIWSVAGESQRADISSTFLQPFLSHTTHTAWTYSLSTEASYDWKAKQWAVPINLAASKLLNLGQQPVSIGGGVRYWATGPDTGPNGWGCRLIVTFLFPK